MNQLYQPDDHAHAISGFVVNLLRVMRGAGNPMDIIGSIERIGKATATHYCSQERTAAACAMADSVRSWDDDLRAKCRRMHEEYGYGSSYAEREILKIDVCRAALRIIASEMDGNWLEGSKADGDLWSAINRFNDAKNQELEREQREYLENLRLENRKLLAAEIRVSRGNARLINSANDNGVGSYVYFITDGEAIKIGKACNPKSRLSGLQTSHHKPLRILHLMPGGEETERALHGKFHVHRLRGEWFRDHPDIREFIRKREEADNDNNRPPDEVAA